MTHKIYLQIVKFDIFYKNIFSIGQNMADNIAAQALGINPNNLWLIQGQQEHVLQ